MCERKAALRHCVSCLLRTCVQGCLIENPFYNTPVSDDSSSDSGIDGIVMGSGARQERRRRAERQRLLADATSCTVLKRHPAAALAAAAPPLCNGHGGADAAQCNGENSDVAVAAPAVQCNGGLQPAESHREQHGTRQAGMAAGGVGLIATGSLQRSATACASTPAVLQQGAGGAGGEAEHPGSTALLPPGPAPAPPLLSPASSLQQRSSQQPSHMPQARRMQRVGLGSGKLPPPMVPPMLGVAAGSSAGASTTMAAAPPEAAHAPLKPGKGHKVGGTGREGRKGGAQGKGSRQACKKKPRGGTWAATRWPSMTQYNDTGCNKIKIMIIRQTRRRRGG